MILLIYIIPETCVKCAVIDKSMGKNSVGIKEFTDDIECSNYNNDLYKPVREKERAKLLETFSKIC